MTITAVMESRVWFVAGWTMLHFLWVGGALGMAAAIGRRVLRSARPEVRYGFALFSLAALALAPAILALFLLESDRLATAPVHRLGWAEPSHGELPDSGPASPALMMSQAASEKTGLPTPVAPSQREFVVSMLDGAANALPWLWVLGSPMTFALLATGLVGAERFRRQSHVLIDGEFPEIVRRLSAILGIARPVALAVCDRVAGPMLIGVVRPLILLPPSVLTGWSPEQIEMALLHELAHVRRHDNLTNLAQRVIESLLFFHPAVWWASGWIRLEREHCCDCLVVAQTGWARPYAELLATLANPMNPSHRCAVAMAERPVVSRIRRILNLEERPMPLSRLAIALAAALFATPALLIVAYAGPETATKPGLNEPDRAKLDDIFAKARHGAEMFNDVQGRVYALKSIAAAKAALGDRDAARKLFAEAVALGETVSLEESTYQGHILQWIANDQLKAGLRDDASETLHKLLRIVEVPAKAEKVQTKLSTSTTDSVMTINVSGIGDHARLFMYQEIMSLQKKIGDLDGAKETLRLGLQHLSKLQKNESWFYVASDAIVKLQASSGDLAGAIRTLENPDRARDPKPENLKIMRVNGLRAIVETIGHENRTGADAVLNEARREADTAQYVTPYMTQLNRSELLRGIAHAFTRLGRYKEALETTSAINAEKHLAGLTDAASISSLEYQKFIKAEAFVQISQAQLKAGDKGGAQASARAAVAVFPPSHQNEHLIKQAATVLAATGETAEARRIADALKPIYKFDAYQEIAAARREASDEKESEAILQEAIKIARANLPAAKPFDLAKPGGDYQSERSQWLQHISQCQIILGDVTGGIQTARSINDDQQKQNALRQLAVDRAAAGDLEGTLKIVDAINGPKTKAEALLWSMTAYSSRKPR